MLGIKILCRLLTSPVWFFLSSVRIVAFFISVGVVFLIGKYNTEIVRNVWEGIINDTIKFWRIK